MQLHKTAKKQRAFAIFKNYIPISFRLWTRQTKLISWTKRSAASVLEFTCSLCNRNDLLRTYRPYFL